MWFVALAVIIITGLAVFGFSKGIFSSGSMKPVSIGIVNGRLSAMPDSPNAVSSQTDIPDKYVEPIKVSVDPETVLKRIEVILREMGNNHIITRGENYIHAVFVTSIMRFHDDVEFLVDSDSGVIHFRSASRVGYSDMGANRKRYEKFRKLYLQK